MNPYPHKKKSVARKKISGDYFQSELSKMINEFRFLFLFLNLNHLFINIIL